MPLQFLETAFIRKPGAPRPVQVIADDAAALTLARTLAEEFAQGAAERDLSRKLPFA